MKTYVRSFADYGIERAYRYRSEARIFIIVNIVSDSKTDLRESHRRRAKR